MNAFFNLAVEKTGIFMNELAAHFGVSLWVIGIAIIVVAAVIYHVTRKILYAVLGFIILVVVVVVVKQLGVL